MKIENIDFKKYQKYIIGGGILLIVVLFFRMYLVHASSTVEEKPELDIEKTEISSEPTITENTDETVLVDVKGAVANPGVYQLSLGCSVMDAINMAGGLLENANTNVINLSKKLTDEMVIIVYTNEEINAYKQDPEVITEFIYIETPCECPDTMNDACIKEETSTSENSNTSTKISINNASIEELMTLSGVGESKAKAIITYREENGNFKDIEEIKNVSGIGEAAFEKIKDYITI